jgi:hypothetical protein
MAIPGAITAGAHGASPGLAALVVAASLVPLPVRITSEIQEPIFAHLGKDADDPAGIEELDALVHGKLEDAVRRMSHRP